MKSRPLQALAAVCVLLIAASCADTPPAPVVDRTRSGTDVGTARAVFTPGKPYTVKQGDTLYAIAFRFGLDVKALARRNAITSPYTIYPGQVIATDLRRTAAAGPKASTTSSTSNRAQTSTPAKVATKPSAKTSSSKPSRPKRVAKTPPSPAKATEPEAPRTNSSPGAPVSRWQWPNRGRVVQRFAPPLKKGIDIAGTRGDAVRAVAPGNVVYAGSGVTGYGQLIIVKHNDEYLSAYGHNDRLLVAEGAAVKAGQPIARMGSSGTDKVKLHFEIRRRGKPVDPLKVLPAR